MPDEFKQREYYQRFKNAFKKSMRRIIAVNCPENDRTIDKAVEIALRYHIALTEDDDDGDGDADEKAVSFAAGAFQPDRATGLENAIAKMTTQLENMSVTLRGHDVRFRSLEDRLTAMERGNPLGGRDSYRDPYRGHGDSRNRDSYRDSYQGREDSRNRDSSHRREDSRDDLDSDRADGEYCAIETGHKRSRNANEAGKMHRGKDFNSWSRRK